MNLVILKPEDPIHEPPVLYRTLLAVEFALLFLGLPLLIIFKIIPNWPVPYLMGMAAVMFYLLWRDPLFKHRRLYQRKEFGKHLRPIVVRFFVLGALFSLITVVAWDEGLFELVLQKPKVWLAIVIGYPILSVYPQEIIYRAFIFQRYRPLFKTQPAMVLASALVFGFAHIIFGNWAAVLLSFVGGLLFGVTYMRSHSLVLTSIDHALFGLLIFTIGLGKYFFHGSEMAF